MLVAMLLALEDLYFAGRKDGEQYNGAAASLACPTAIITVDFLILKHPIFYATGAALTRR